MIHVINEAVGILVTIVYFDLLLVLKYNKVIHTQDTNYHCTNSELRKSLFYTSIAYIISFSLSLLNQTMLLNQTIINQSIN